MELTQKDYEERVNRVAAGQGDDEDLRLIKHYESQGFSTRQDSVGKQAGAPEGETSRPTQPTEVKPTKATQRGSSGFKSQD